MRVLSFLSNWAASQFFVKMKRGTVQLHFLQPPKAANVNSFCISFIKTHTRKSNFEMGGPYIGMSGILILVSARKARSLKKGFLPKFRMGRGQWPPCAIDWQQLATALLQVTCVQTKVSHQNIFLSIEIHGWIGSGFGRSKHSNYCRKLLVCAGFSEHCWISSVSRWTLRGPWHGRKTWEKERDLTTQIRQTNNKK